jgi:hypothetical protein
MTPKKQALKAKFGPETGFEVRPVSAVPFRDLQESNFERLKGRLLAQRLDEEAWEPEFNSYIRRAANEASALAWVTPYPVLFFPALFEEKVRNAQIVSERQKKIHRRSRELILT